VRKFIIIFAFLVFSYLQIHWQISIPTYEANPYLRTWLRTELTKTQALLTTSFLHLNDKVQLQKIYAQARTHYKQVEFFVEYCSPREAKNFINGPLVPKSDFELSNKVIPPRGFQRIEELLFTDDSLDVPALREQYELLIPTLNELNTYYETIEIQDGQVLEMCQLQLFRIAAMNLSGYDQTIAQDNVTESYWCMEGIKQVLDRFKPYSNGNNNLVALHAAVMKEVEKAKGKLQQHPDYASFKRLDFITNNITPLNKLLVEFHQQSKLPWSGRIQAINLQNGFLFGKESFNMQYFSMYYNDTTNLKLQAALGKLLFFDPILSGNNQNACSSCHDPSKGFTDGLTKGLDFNRTNSLPRNTPTLLNVIFQKAFFYDGRAYQLEQQIFDVVHNKAEMQSNFADVIKKLKKNTTYSLLFQQAFKNTPDADITSYSIQKAIMEYEKTLVSMNSRFDQYLHGNKMKLNAREINGYNLFAGKALCGSCHFLPLFNGTVPPFYTDSEYEVIGVPQDTTNQQLDIDRGRFNVTALTEQSHAFKTPTIRNTALTAPYMHNGAYATLESVMEFYHKGGGRGLKLDVPNQTLPFDSLQLSSIEKADIVLFLKTLTDTSGLTHIPSLPQIQRVTTSATTPH
jgi:cytochrome c peroxidase